MKYEQYLAYQLDIFAILFLIVEIHSLKNIISTIIHLQNNLNSKVI